MFPPDGRRLKGKVANRGRQPEAQEPAAPPRQEAWFEQIRDILAHKAGS
jgi:hypothetical protein